MKACLVLYLGWFLSISYSLYTQKEDEIGFNDYGEDICDIYDSLLIDEPKLEEFYEKFLKIFYETLTTSEGFLNADKTKQLLMVDEINRLRMIFDTPEEELHAKNALKAMWVKGMKDFKEIELRAVLTELHAGNLRIARINPELPIDSETGEL